MHPTHEELDVKVAVLTVSDTRTVEDDRGGKIIQDLLHEAGFTLADYDIIKDEPRLLVERMKQWHTDLAISAIIITGGTGFTPRDQTYDTITPLFDKEMTGFGELFRMLSYDEIGPRAMFSRATAGSIGQTAVYLLPGSTNAVKLGMTKLILPTVQHFIGELKRV